MTTYVDLIVQKPPGNTTRLHVTLTQPIFMNESNPNLGLDCLAFGEVWVNSDDCSQNSVENKEERTE